MIKKNLVVNMSSSLEDRPIAKLVQVAGQFESNIHITHGSKKINAKSIMGMMTLILKDGEELIVEADGVDERKALASIEDFLVLNN